ncbi:MAG: glycosyltransferase [Blastocatellales bacterium]
MYSSNTAKYQVDNIPSPRQPNLTTENGIDLAYQSAEMRRVLLVSYSFPPNREMGAYTCAQIARYLPMYGWRPIVLTVKEKYLEEQFPKHDGVDSLVEPDFVVRTAMLPHPLDIYRRFKSSSLTGKLFRAGNQQATSPNNAVGDKSTLGAKRSARDLLLSILNLPDAHTGWLIPAVMTGLRAIKRTKAQAIYSSAPYFTNHLAGYALALLTGLPWVAHFRDPWVTGSPAEYCANDLYFRINRALERMIVARADAVVCVTEEHAALMRAAYDQIPASKLAVVMNGFDGLEWEEAGEALAQSAHCQAGKPRKFRITYTGTLYMKRNPAPLFRALRSLVDAGEIAREEVSVELIGWCESSEGRNVADLVVEAGLEECVSIIGPLNHLDTLSRLSQSDLLLLLAEGLVTQIPGKTFEYLKTHRPILALTSEGSLANLLRRTGGGWVINPSDHAGIVTAVRECYRSWKYKLPGRKPDSSVVESFDRRRTTGLIAELLNSFAR